MEAIFIYDSIDLPIHHDLVIARDYIYIAMDSNIYVLDVNGAPAALYRLGNASVLAIAKDRDTDRLDLVYAVRSNDVFGGINVSFFRVGKAYLLSRGIGASIYLRRIDLEKTYVEVSLYTITVDSLTLPENAVYSRSRVVYLSIGQSIGNDRLYISFYGNDNRLYSSALRVRLYRIWL